MNAALLGCEDKSEKLLKFVRQIQGKRVHPTCTIQVVILLLPQNYCTYFSKHMCIYFFRKKIKILSHRLDSSVYKIFIMIK